jgi:hypothetical protein
MAMDRRAFVRQAAKSAMALPLSAMTLSIAAQTAAAQKPAAQTPAAPTFLPDAHWRSTWASALEVLAGNVRKAPRFDAPILFEGSTYQGAWQECGPHESLVYASLAHYVAPREDGLTPSEIARNTHRAFFHLQREDGQLPAAVKMSDVGFGQIQMVVPIAATAWDLAQSTHDEAFLQEAYTACARWDAWLMRYRNTRGTGLIEAFCTYDTGQDNSPTRASASTTPPCRASVLISQQPSSERASPSPRWQRRLASAMRLTGGCSRQRLFALSLLRSSGAKKTRASTTSTHKTTLSVCARLPTAACSANTCCGSTTQASAGSSRPCGSASSITRMPSGQSIR